MGSRRRWGRARRPRNRRISWLRVGTLLAVLCLGCATLLAACASGSDGRSAKTVVVYTSVDQMYSEPILKDFEEQTGIRVQAVYDVEATKTVGLANRLLSEKERPLADVFWNGEILETLRLKDEGVLAPFESPSTEGIYPQFVDPEGYWAGIAGRARVILVNTDLLSPEEYPESIYDLLDPRWPAEQVGIAYPMFGTTSTHAAALYAYLGEDKARAFFEGLAERGVQVVDGNSVAKDLVAAGRLAFAMTDTDDACAAIKAGRPVTAVFPDQGDGGMGTLVIPNTIALVRGAPHPQEAQVLIDYLLSEEVERQVVKLGWSHLPVRPLAVEPECFDVGGVASMNVQYEALFDWLEPSRSELAEIFIR